MKYIFCSIVAIASIFLYSNVHANDSIARVSTGGIVLLKSKDIEMEKEVLQISRKSIRVQYQFLNKSSKDIHSMVAFPMPPYGWISGASSQGLNVKSMGTFVVRVNGTKVTTWRTMKAVIGERDITNDLRKAGLTEAQIFENFGNFEDGYNKIFHGTLSKKLRSLGAISKDQYPEWKIAETIYWDQIFSHTRPTSVEHEYEPFKGMTYSTPFQRGERSGDFNENARDKEPKEACVDDGTHRAIEQRIKLLAETGPEMVYVVLEDIEYILGTGRNWKGPIKDFTLLIEKDSPDQIVSLCFPGKAKRVSQTTLEFKQKNFVPEDKLIVYFFSIKDDYQ